MLRNVIYVVVMIIMIESPAYFTNIYFMKFPNKKKIIIIKIVEYRQNRIDNGRRSRREREQKRPVVRVSSFRHRHCLCNSRKPISHERTAWRGEQDQQRSWNHFESI